MRWFHIDGADLLTIHKTIKEIKKGRGDDEYIVILQKPWHSLFLIKCSFRLFLEAIKNLIK